MSRRFWPIGEAAQADYETLREAVLTGQRPDSVAAARFERRGLAGLIAGPAAEPVFAAVLLGAQRPPRRRMAIRVSLRWPPALH